MARLTDNVREGLRDMFGEWAILRADQRRKIRELCDLCDMFENTADELAGKPEKSKWVRCEDASPNHNGRYLTICEGVRTAVIRLYKNGAWNSMHRVLYWQELPRAPREDNNEIKTREGKGNDGKQGNA